MADEIIVLLAIFLAAFTQSISGFGSALVAMAILPPVIGIRTATPFVALVLFPLVVYLLFHYRKALNIGVIWRLTLAALIGIPIGILYFSHLNEEIVLTVLGIVITSYALYALFNFRLPKLSHPAWGYIAGFLGGLLGGAYNTPGPPVILYGDCRRWERDEFKSNLQGFFLVSSIVVNLGHAWSGNHTPAVWHYVLISLPALALGILAGATLNRYVNPELFRKIVLVLLVVMGLRLILV
jgi:uncharacterized membrane protein YfcA